MRTVQRMLAAAAIASHLPQLDPHGVDGKLRLEGFVALPVGTRLIRDHLVGQVKNPEDLGEALAKLLIHDKLKLQVWFLWTHYP